MRQALGPKKLAKASILFGRPVEWISVRGGNPHFTGYMKLKDEPDLFYSVNWQTGEWDEYSSLTKPPLRSGTGVIPKLEKGSVLDG